VILSSSAPGRLAKFRRALGVPLGSETHQDGPPHLAAEVGPAHVAIWRASPSGSPWRRKAGAAMIGLRVRSLDAAVDAARRAGGSVVRRPEDAPWGRRAVVRDPEGRYLELNEENTD
jgi:lactoylglutathione lyase